MDSETAKVLQIAGYSIGAIGITYVIAKNWYLKKKSDNETYQARIQAIKELMESPGFKEYTQKRKDLAEKLATDSEYEDMGLVKSLVKAALGKFDLKKIK